MKYIVNKSNDHFDTISKIKILKKSLFLIISWYIVFSSTKFQNQLHNKKLIIKKLHKEIITIPHLFLTQV